LEGEGVSNSFLCVTFQAQQLGQIIQSPSVGIVAVFNSIVVSLLGVN
jgi:hypothetical protein